ncbi:MAG: GMC oxidoreductase, partial [Alphaproteobacteria bacterium]
MVEADKRARHLLVQPAFDGVRGEELAPGLAVRSDDEILDFLRRAASCAHHPVGTCKMGVAGDSLAVVDDNLRVCGVDGLRVIDA